MGWTYSKNEGQQVDQTLHRVATKEREEIKRTTMQKMARRPNKEGGNRLEQESNRQKAMEDIDGGLHPAVDGQSLGEGEGEDLSLRELTLYTEMLSARVQSGPPTDDNDCFVVMPDGGTVFPGTERAGASLSYHSLVGQVVKAPRLESGRSGFESLLRRDFFGVESYQ